jgi:hypothetical protein
MRESHHVQAGAAFIANVSALGQAFAKRLSVEQVMERFAQSWWNVR